MIFNKEVLNCSTNVYAKMDTSKESIRKSLEKNTLRMNCEKIGWIVDLDSNTFMGAPLNVACLNDKCKFYRKRVDLTSPVEKDKLGQG